MLNRAILATLTTLTACADDGNNVTHDITVEIYRSFPFIPGDTADDATFVAVQDGDGPFVAAAGTNGVHRVPITNNRFGVAVGCDDSTNGSFVDIEIIQQTVEDGLIYQTLCKTRPEAGTLSVTVQGMQPDQRLRLRTARNINQMAADGTIDMLVPAGPTELFATLTDANRNVLKLFRIPSIEVTPTANITIDVATQGVVPDRGTFTISPDDPLATIRTAVVRPYGTVSLTGNTNAIGDNRNYLMMPAALRQSDDLFRFTINRDGRSASRTVKSPGALAFTLPSPFTAPNPELLETPFLHPVWTFTPAPAVLPNQSYFLDANNFGDFNAPLLREWFVTLSARWVAGQSTVRYEFPDLSQMPGFSSVALIARERIETTIQRQEDSGPFNVDGSESATSASSGVIGKFCGDGVVQAPEEVCDPGDAFETEDCDLDCTPAVCGDNVVNFAAGEDCDPPDGTTCGATCTAL